MQNFWKTLEQSLVEKDIQNQKILEVSLRKQDRGHALKSQMANRIPPVNRRPRIYLGKPPAQISKMAENGYSFYMC